MQTSELLQSSSLSLPSGSYIYSVIPVTSSNTVAAISSDDTLRIFDSTTLQVISNCAFGKIHEGVTCLKNLDAKAGVLVTAGRDAKIRCFDPRTGLQSLEFTHGNNTRLRGRSPFV
jgi:WD40 repeat protein